MPLDARHAHEDEVAERHRRDVSSARASDGHELTAEHELHLDERAEEAADGEGGDSSQNGETRGRHADRPTRGKKPDEEPHDRGEDRQRSQRTELDVAGPERQDVQRDRDDGEAGEPTPAPRATYSTLPRPRRG